MPTINVKNQEERQLHKSGRIRPIRSIINQSEIDILVVFDSVDDLNNFYNEYIDSSKYV